MKRTNLALLKGVNPENVDFAVFKAGKLVDGKTTFETALDKVITDNSTLLTGQQSFSTGRRQSSRPLDTDAPKDLGAAIEARIKQQFKDN